MEIAKPIPGHACQVATQMTPAGVTFWEAVAESRWGKHLTEVERHAIIQAQSLAGKPARALEVGCEGGRWSKLLSDLGWEMTCIDVDPTRLAVCQERIPRARCLLAKSS